MIYSKKRLTLLNKSVFVKYILTFSVLINISFINSPVIKIFNDFPSSRTINNSYENYNLDGSWEVRIDDENSVERINVEGETGTLNFNSPVTLKLKLNKKSDLSYDMLFNGIDDATPSFLTIYNEFKDRIDTSVSIGNIKFLSNNEIVLEWNGVVLKNNRLWLKEIDDAFWGKIKIVENKTFVNLYRVEQ